MKRKIYQKLLEWKNSRKGETALMVEGARRVGKSYVVEEFAKQEYKSYILIDFNKVGEDIKHLFDIYLDDLDMLFMHLSVYSGKQLYPRESLIIFDEVQFCPRARTAIKYLVADGRYDYIETGTASTTMLATMQKRSSVSLTRFHPSCKNTRKSSSWQTLARMPE